MVYVLVELGGHKQLSRLRGNLIAETFDSLTGLVEYTGGRRILAEKGAVLFALEAPANDRLAEFLGRFHEILRRKRRDLQGFIIYAEEFEESNAGLPHLRLAHAALLTDQSETLRIGRRLWLRLKRFLVTSQSGDYFEVLGRSHQPDATSVWAEALLERKSAIDRITSALRPFVERREPPLLLHVCGPRLTGKTQTVAAALRTFAPSPGEARWLTLSASSAGSPGFEPFLRSVHHEALAELADFLKPAERAMWEQRRSVFASICPDFLAEDFYAAYSHYLLAHNRSLDRRGLPPIVVCVGLESFSAEASELLARLIGKFQDFSPIIPISISNLPEPPPALAAIPRATIAIGPMDRDELATALERAGEESPHDVEELLRRSEGKPLFVGHSISLNAESEATGEAISYELLGELELACRKSLYVLTILDGILGRDDCAVFLGHLGLMAEIVAGAIDRLTSLGFLERTTGQLVLPELADRLAEEFRPEGLDSKAADFCIGLWASGRLRGDGRLARFLASNGRFDQALEVLFHYVTDLLDRGEVDSTLSYLENEDLFPSPLDSNRARRRDLYMDIASLRASVLLKEKDHAELHLMKARDARPESLRELSMFELASAQHQYAGREFRSALDSAKKALIATQGIAASDLECRANIEIGLAMLAAARFEEAEDYFTIARESLGTEQPSYDLLRSLGFEAVTHFNFGNYSKADRSAEHAGEVAGAVCRREWQRFLLLLRGRCHFSLGLYDEAGRFFQSGTSFCRMYPHAGATRTFAAWGARAAHYSGAREAQKNLESLEPVGETLFFLGELCVASAEWQTAINLFDRAMVALEEEREPYLPSELVTWTNGFAGVEDRSFRNANGLGMLYQTARALRAYAIGNLGKREEAIDELVRITREEKLSDQDPNEFYYYFLHSLMLPEGDGDLLVDRLTVLNKALKHVQERATRIDEVKLRQAFLQASRWNVRLFADARKHKLV